jgi:hypothetical protein
VWSCPADLLHIFANGIVIDLASQPISEARRFGEIDPTGARKLDKAKSSERIDGMVALVMAVGLAARCPIPELFEPRLAVLTA